MACGNQTKRKRFITGYVAIDAFGKRSFANCVSRGHALGILAVCVTRFEREDIGFF